MLILNDLLHLSLQSLKLCLEEAQIFRLIDHLQAAGGFALVVHGFDRFSDYVHVRLGVHAARNGEAGQLKLGVVMIARLWVASR